MKRYNRAGSKLVFLGIILPILAFLMTVNLTYSYFTAKAQDEYGSLTTGMVLVCYNTEGSNTVNIASVCGDTSYDKILPGATLTFDGGVKNAGSGDAYIVLHLVIECKGTELINKFYDASGAEIVKSGSSYTTGASLVSKNATVNFSLEYVFDYMEFDDTYQGETVSYTLRARAIQKETLSLTTATDELLKPVG